MRQLCFRLALVVVILVAGTAAPGADKSTERIQPCPRNTRFWQYQGTPVILLGGTPDDNLFQLPDLEQHLDELAEVGGNYIRNTMSDRHDKGFELYPFKRRDDGKYDLDHWNDKYWKRFERMLEMTAERDIIVQIEVWDRFDYSDLRGGTNWINHPYNPKNNVNYSSEQSGLKTTYKNHPGQNEQPFFFTVPELRNDALLLKYQIAQVDKMLSYTLRHGNVLYCMDNETSGREQWSTFWAKHIRKRAAERGVNVETTEMWDDWNPMGEHHKRTFDHPELYTFVDVSQNNHNKGQQHWDNLLRVRDYVGRHPRPMNTVKIYGADTGRYGNSRDGEERFWRNILGGCAGTRFHRPDSGLGLSDRAKPHIRGMRMVLEELDIFNCQPDTASKQLSDREPNEAYLTRIPRQQYAVYFPDGGAVRLDLSAAAGKYASKWLDVSKSRWTMLQEVRGGGSVPLKTPAKGHWVCLLKRTN